MAELDGVYRLIDSQGKRFEDLQDTMKDGFDGIHERLDKLNGQTDENSTDITKIKTVSRTVGLIYGGLITLLGLIGGCQWVAKDQAKISVGQNLNAPTGQSIPSNGGKIGQ